MKKLSSINKFIFLLNNVVATILVASFFIPNLIPEKFGIITLLSLIIPAIIILNILFIIYWILIGFKKQLILSFFVLIVSFLFIPKLYKFNEGKATAKKEHLKVMTYNVRKFNIFNWLHVENIDTEIKKLINEEDPDIIAIQEYRSIENFNLNFPYSYNYITNKNVQSGLAIFSKYPIINKGSVGYDHKSIDAIYIDIIKKNDTIRFYNFRLASTGVVPDQDYFGHKDSERLIKRLRASFKEHQKQVIAIHTHVNNCKYKVILAGDLNNTAYSWDYKNIKNDLQDTFLKSGTGFGKTYEFLKFPLRIDYIFIDKSIKVIDHKNLHQKYSDHFPIEVTLEL